MNQLCKNTRCLACGSDSLEIALDLKSQPLANSYLDTINDHEERFPLAVDLCSDCFHLQLTHSVDPSIIFKNYLYVSGTSQTLKDNMRWFAGYVNESVDRIYHRVLDIGCNDGTQLDFFKDLGYTTHGIDPAENIFPISSRNHEVICDFFGPNSVDLIAPGFDAITAQNVLAHNADPLNFLKSCCKIMDSHTKLFVQTSQADMILNDEFDTIYHEHINFFNTNSMAKLANRAGLNLVEVIKSPIHGVSYIFVFSLGQKRQHYLDNQIDREARLGLFDKNTYDRWRNNVIRNTHNLKDVLYDYRSLGLTLVGYGAAAKGNTLLNFVDIKLDFIIDDNPLKQGKFTPGSRCPIVGINHLLEFGHQDRLVFIPLAWNFFSEIQKKILSVRNMPGDKFVKYFPKVEIES